MTESTKPKEGLTSADIKKQIEEATKAQKSQKTKTDLKDSGLPLVGQVANEINASQGESSTTEVKPVTESKPEQDKIPAAEQKPTENVDLKEWAKKKNIDWTTNESILAALRQSDQEWHKKRAEDLKREQTKPQPYAPSYPPISPQPYAYPQPPVVPNQRQVVENLARQYNMLPEDVERLAAFNRDFFEAASRSERERMEKEMEQIRRENEKISVFQELASDPVFRRPDVVTEFNAVLEEMRSRDPQSFEQNPTSYRIAFDRAVNNLGRRYLEGRGLQEGTPPQAIPMTPPTTPPRPLGQGNAGGALENEQGIDPDTFRKLPLEEKRKVLERAGLRSAY